MSIWCSTGMRCWSDRLPIVHLPFGRYCKTLWTRLYANDTRLYFAFRPFKACVIHVDSWSVRNKLKLSSGKPSYLFWIPAITHAQILRPSKYPGERIPVSSAKIFGVIIDLEMTFAEHLTTICKTCFLHLRNIVKIRDSLSQVDTETLVQAFISSKLASSPSLVSK